MSQQPPDPTRPGDYSTPPTWQQPPPDTWQQPSQPDWQQPAMPPPPYAYAPRATTNGLSIASLVLGIVWLYWLGSILAVVFGHIALRQIRDSNGMQEGRGMAIAGLVLGYIGIGIAAILVIVGAIVAATSPA